MKQGRRPSNPRASGLRLAGGFEVYGGRMNTRFEWAPLGLVAGMLLLAACAGDAPDEPASPRSGPSAPLLARPVAAEVRVPNTIHDLEKALADAGIDGLDRECAPLPPPGETEVEKQLQRDCSALDQAYREARRAVESERQE